jgi:hypothetical protein
VRSDWDAFLPTRRLPGPRTSWSCFVVLYGDTSLCGEGLCIGYDGGDRVSTSYPHRFEFTGGRIVKVVFDVADDAYTDVEAHFAAAMARD